MVELGALGKSGTLEQGTLVKQLRDAKYEIHEFFTCHGKGNTG